ncbi:MAG: hypothetical protein K6F29_01700 [Bacteroidales bacterium]|nr:hypothetical protein [Bacteroidales bacterium]
MKKLLLICILISSTYALFSQYVYFGYPNSNVSLRKGDIIVVNIPSFYMTGYHFVQGPQLDNLAQFLKNNDSLSFRIDINFCIGGYCKDISDKLKEHLCIELQNRIPNQNNYNIKSKGLENPIYNKNKDSEKSREEIIKYEYYNTRLEIIVE